MNSSLSSLKWRRLVFRYQTLAGAISVEATDSQTFTQSHSQHSHLLSSSVAVVNPGSVFLSSVFQAIEIREFLTLKKKREKKKGKPLIIETRFKPKIFQFSSYLDVVKILSRHCTSCAHFMFISTLLCLLYNFPFCFYSGCFP